MTFLVSHLINSYYLFLAKWCLYDLQVKESIANLKMKLRQQEVDSVQDSIRETIMLLSKSHLKFKTEISVEGLIAITLDQDEVVVIKIGESFQLSGKHSLRDSISRSIYDEGLSEAEDAGSTGNNTAAESEGAVEQQQKLDCSNASPLEPKKAGRVIGEPANSGDGSVSEEPSQEYAEQLLDFSRDGYPPDVKPALSPPVETDDNSQVFSSSAESYQVGFSSKNDSARNNSDYSPHISSNHSSQPAVSARPVLNIPNAPRRLLYPHSQKRHEKQKQKCSEQRQRLHCSENSRNHLNSEHSDRVVDDSRMSHEDGADSPLNLEFNPRSERSLETHLPSVSQIKVEPGCFPDDQEMGEHSDVAETTFQNNMLVSQQRAMAAAYQAAAFVDPGFLSQSSAGHVLFPSHPAFMFGNMDVTSNWAHGLASYSQALPDLSPLTQLRAGNPKVASSVSSFEFIS